MIKLIRLYFKTLSVISPKLAGHQAFNLFQKPLNKKVRTKELSFFKVAKRFTVRYYLEDIQCYELGPNDGKLVLMVHGWESNAASMSGIALELAEQGYHIILFNLPAHGFSKLKKSNMKICKEAFLEVLNHINPSESFSVVSHSFGSAVTAYALSKTTYNVENLVFLTSPNKITDVFRDFSKFVRLGKKGQIVMNNMASNLLKEPLEDLIVEKLSDKIRYDHLTLIHDVNDVIIPVKNSINIRGTWPSSTFYGVKDKGHYRMLWDEEVLGLVKSALSENKSSQKEQRHALLV